mmetsp:Transcript_28214/g.51021  ORF Transcript_28214/g.51021 Transcript_28214/m.51021 type:complete len:122 (+) Transcript_28214:144-509(+)
MPTTNRLILSLCLASGCAIGGSSSFIAPARTSLLLRSSSLPTPHNVPSFPNGITWRLFGGRGGGGGKKDKKPSKANLPEKICVVCDRPFAWRKKWERCWDEVTCCSKSCNAKRKSLAKEEG